MRHQSGRKHLKSKYWNSGSFDVFWKSKSIKQAFTKILKIMIDLIELCKFWQNIYLSILIYTQLYGISHSKLFLSCIWIITYIWSSMISLVFPTKIPIFRRKIPYELVVNYLKIELIPSNSTMPYALSFAIFHEFVSKHLSKKQIITKV